MKVRLVQFILALIFIKESLCSEEKNCTVEDQLLDVIFLIDGSDSVGKENFILVKEWIIGITKEALDFESTFVNVGVIQYSHWFPDRPMESQNYMKTEIRLGKIRYFGAFMRAVKRIKLQGYTTFTAHALHKAAHDFDKYGRKNATKVAILLTDGAASDSELLENYSQELRDHGVTIIAVGVGNIKEKELRIIASGDPSNPTGVYEFDAFEDLQSVIINMGKQIICHTLENDEGKNMIAHNPEMEEDVESEHNFNEVEERNYGKEDVGGNEETGISETTVISLGTVAGALGGVALSVVSYKVVKTKFFDKK